MSAQLTLRSLSRATIKAMLDDGTELALIDVREELTFSQNHLLWARNVPLSRLELRFAILVPRLTTRIVLCDDNDGLAKRAATILANAGYTDLSYLQGGIAAWAAAGFVLFSGVHVPSKAFGEFVEHDSGTPSISAGELNAMMRNGSDIKVLDSRPFDEYARISIPTGINVPGAELVLRVRDIVPSPGTTIVVNCADEPEASSARNRSSMPACRTKSWRYVTALWAGNWQGSHATAARPPVHRPYQTLA